MHFSNHIDIYSSLTTLDGVVFLAVFVATFFAVAIGKKMEKQGGVVEYLLMGRQLTFPLFVATLVSSWYGGIFPVTQLAFENGISTFITQGVFWYVSYLLFALILAKRVWETQSITLAELVSKEFGPKSGKLAAIFNFFDVLPIQYVLSLGLLLQLLFGGSLIFMMCIGAFAVAIYTMVGGFRAVVFSDFIQFFVMCLSVFMVLAFSLLNFGVEVLYEKLDTSHFQISFDPKFWMWGFIALSTLVDPCFYQRCFAAKSYKVARKGILASIVIWILFDICTVGGAMYAKALIPNANSNQAYLIYACQILPSGVRGFVLAGIFATILSTLDSYLFISGTTISYDASPKKWKGKICFHKISILFVAFLSIFVGYFFQGNVKLVWKLFGSYAAACFLFPVLFGFIFPKRISDNNFVFSSLLGAFIMTFYPNLLGEDLERFYVGLFCVTLSLTFSLFTSMGKDVLLQIRMKGRSYLLDKLKL